MAATPAAEGLAVSALRSVLLRVQQAAEKSGRPAERVRVVAVSKTKPVSLTQHVYDAGHRCFGENYVQEIIEKAPQEIERGGWTSHRVSLLRPNGDDIRAPTEPCHHQCESPGVLSDFFLEEAAKGEPHRAVGPTVGPGGMSHWGCAVVPVGCPIGRGVLVGLPRCPGGVSQSRWDSPPVCATRWGFPPVRGPWWRPPLVCKVLVGPLLCAEPRWGFPPGCGTGGTSHWMRSPCGSPTGHGMHTDESGRVAGSAPADPDPESGQTRPESGGVGLSRPESGRQGPTRLRVGRLGAESADSAIHVPRCLTLSCREGFGHRSSGGTLDTMR
ncbi:hypothetical protein Taro_007476 [Colocasia esculenta]|uniref:Pyridoxal phosphate homeostasis protein n=1 Tax=Colocasia esculenta TaxID=4460 RepID=A0A843TU75_COLES|nr:hypothetical protein [Colocasia esculenta]